MTKKKLIAQIGAPILRKKTKEVVLIKVVVVVLEVVRNRRRIARS